MNKKELDSIRAILTDREYQAVTKLIEEVSGRNISQDNVGSYITEIKNTLNTISYRKDMLTNALNALERYLECGKRDDIQFEESIRGSQLLDA